MQHREYGIDILKIIAICGVVALHTQRNLSTGELYNPFLYYMARFAMPVFFMINGYLILNRPSFDKKYYLKKLKNIIRVLITWGFVAFLFSAFIMRDDVLSAIKNAIKCSAGYYIVPFWFLLTFSIIYTVLIFSFSYIKNNIKRLVILLGAACIFVDLISLVIISRGGYFLQSYVPQRYRLWTWLFYFLMGYYLGKINIRIKKRNLWILLILVSAISVMYQYCLCFKYLGKINSEYCYDNIIIIIWSVLIFKAFQDHKFRCVKAISIIVENCFGVFLIHEFISHYFELTDIVADGYQSMLMWLGLCIVSWILTYIIRKIPNSFIQKMFTY